LAFHSNYGPIFIISEIKQYIGRKSHLTPQIGVSVVNTILFSTAKTRMVVKKVWEYSYYFQYNVHTWQMDRQTDTAWRRRTHVFQGRYCTQRL